MLTTNKASNAYEIAAIIFSYNTLTLAIIGTAFNLLTLFMLCRATFNDAKKMPVLYYMRVIAILDILMLYDWNLDHYRNTIYAFTIVRSSVVFCKFISFINYFVPQSSAWIRVLAEKKPLFPIEIWNVYDRTIANLPRSNNSIKGWHNAFTKCVAIVHPTITKLIEKIRREQSKFEGDIAQTRQGQESKPQKLKYRKLDERIKRLVDDYANVDLGEYLKGLAVNIFVFVVL
ncbi:unnamed protein product [Rotaria socialis]|uniref:G-protein coupled receptors family 1 profile domain-containing protein n=1 Tax=Rotaria socialis TaxID=392032 RepID=A0A818AQT3_9BILA|nr:unnamed protein product [Rotaria socialis]